MDAPETDRPLEALLENHRAFCGTCSVGWAIVPWRRTSSRNAFAKVVARPEQAPSDEGVVPWFYRTLRNAAIDHLRRRGAAGRAYEAFARELNMHESPTEEITAEICACVSRLFTRSSPSNPR